MQFTTTTGVVASIFILLQVVSAVPLPSPIELLTTRSVVAARGKGASSKKINADIKPHPDHGKTTLNDRIISAPAGQREPYRDYNLDSADLEKERHITITQSKGKKPL
ncbi:hypothetical protein B0O99DRAFT_695040 [Bisporella sp. PMI_857]|nr:hypothetical protein B0O99DRAFT_695040 [Bisporella sp. PMI_857]